MKAGEVIAETIEKQLAHVRERRAGVESRGQMVITTSGTLVTLQLAFVTVVAPDRATVSTIPRVFLGLSLVAFLGAAVFGVLTNLPRAWSEMDPESLKPLVAQQRLWDAVEEKARRQVAKAQLAVLTASMSLVRKMSRRLTAAIVSEVIGMAMLAIAILLIMLKR
ncbi:hypothetical protein ABZ896_41450 [Streptomyces sp. NPDC047072]|uniref:hypothetical protein n=1 Tax=Streptomyces sp. NPDC047072 TaxID=3154809 RepID=UPI0033D67F02